MRFGGKVSGLLEQCDVWWNSVRYGATSVIWWNNVRFGGTVCCFVQAV